MATLINNAGVQHYANKMCDANNRKVGSKSLPTALSDIDNLIDEMKTQFDAEYGSVLDVKLNNNENIFSVGTGTSIDKRSEVENSFTDIELSGNSLVNLAIPSSSSKRFYKSDRRYILGKSTINLFKSNTTYTVFFEVSNLVLDDVVSVDIQAEHVRFNNHGSQLCKVTSNGFYKGTFSTGTLDNTSLASFVLKGTSAQWDDAQSETMEITLSKVVVLEGDWTNKPVPQYFEGLKSIGEKEDGNHKISISSTGKNLCPYNNAEFQANETRPWIDMLGVEGIYGGSNVANITRTWFYLLEGKYKLSYKTENCIIQVIDKNENILNLNNKFKGGYVCIRIKSNTTSGTYSVKDLQIELSETQTHYEPYKEDKKEILLNEPLRSVGDTKDTIEKINGEWKIVRRCGCLTLNGSEQWNTPLDGNVKDGNTKLFAKSQGFESLDNTSINIISDKFPSYNADFVWSNDLEGISANKYGTLHLRINTSKLSEITSNELKNWLAQNPVKCVYKLVTPIIEDISPVTLQCWNNGTISIDEVLPMETTHTVALNKPAQIKRNIEELTALRKRVEALEDFYDKVALEQSHQLSLISHSIELDYNI